MRRLNNAVLGLATAWTLAFASGCATAAVYTEEGLYAAEIVWHETYSAKLRSCTAQHEPSSDGAEQCFGKMYDADAQVREVITASVQALRMYWRARAAGIDGPSWREVAAQVAALVAQLPPEAVPTFERVRGLR